MSEIVNLKDLRFGWKRTEPAVLDIPDFSVKRGESVFIHGPSGSGKSVLLSLIAGILQPQSGSVVVCGTRIDALSGSARDAFRADRIGFIFQRFNLIPYLTPFDNVLIPCELSGRRRAEAGVPLEKARDLLTRLDLPPALWDRRAAMLSVGEQQRVAAARALIGAPDLIIADEPTSALDSDRREGFLRLLLSLRASSSLIFVSHDLSLAGAFDRTAAIGEISRIREDRSCAA
ncbi:MAG: ABC transporter ATP-binding protein [Helicobacteraceae bacterium]|jgi:putative ABC transport system ATP-binding protein|nr:ABC transporter ATP-binding protein [Helicobacteraceae bacterium]